MRCARERARAMDLLLALPPPFWTPLSPSSLPLWRTLNPIRRLPLPLKSRTRSDHSLSLLNPEPDPATPTPSRFQIRHHVKSLARWLSLYFSRGKIRCIVVSLPRQFSVRLDSRSGVAAGESLFLSIPLMLPL
ncbi:unnamed protein product [Linum trigynum]|uniref:Uncharacterized protein n=1 Tax=Linum trigynum TaxID=586398 RepID=A0AAV2G8V7_9ROSI